MILAARSRSADIRDGRPVLGSVPIVAVSGVNGKTTTTRLAAHIFRTLGRHVGMTNTEGIYYDGRRIETGDCSGPQSAQKVLANPLELNSRLGTYTNFVNLLDLCGLALPAAMRADGIPFGITLLAPAGHDARLASIGRVFHADTKLKMGAKGLTQPRLAALPTEANGDEIAIAVVGAHLSGMALNGELQTLGGRLLEATATAPDYKLYALDTTPPKPGMLRVDAGAGSSIKLELWALSAAAFGKFVAAIPPPLGIGTVRLEDGRSVKGFVVEPAAINDARDISAFGGWRAFVRTFREQSRCPWVVIYVLRVPGGSARTLPA